MDLLISFLTVCAPQLYMLMPPKYNGRIIIRNARSALEKMELLHSVTGPFILLMAKRLQSQLTIVDLHCHYK
jgi:hypothetical protein